MSLSIRIVCLVMVGLLAKQTVFGQHTLVNFDRDIRPILSDKCFQCHGPDEEARQAELRLDDRVGLLGDRQPAIVVPGKPLQSELVLRITSDDPDERMPPADAKKQLTPQEIDLIRSWIELGAIWEQHWSYRIPRRPEPPRLARLHGGSNPIDVFVAQRLESESVTPSPSADKITLVRRLYFDLWGMPPSWDAVRAFVSATREPAYERLVDRLLSSPHFGERMAMYWLDVVRYADSNGYHSDEPRAIAPYRNYVIDAFNANLPFDQFVVEQLAGDLIPGASMRQKVASGFNMLLQTTNEGGAQPKEYLAKYAADRVRNTSAIFLGSTMGCAECHDHKYDPFTTRDFYEFAAIFADIDEKGVGNPPAFPVIEPADQCRLDDFDHRIQQAEAELSAASSTDRLAAEQAGWEKRFVAEKLPLVPRLDVWYTMGPIPSDSADVAFETAYPPESEIDLTRTYDQGTWSAAGQFTDGTSHSLVEVRGASYFFRRIHAQSSFNLEVSVGSDDGIKVWLNGELLLNNNIRRAAAADQERIRLDLQPGENELLIKIVNDTGPGGFYFEALPFGVPSRLLPVISTAPADRAAEDASRLSQYFPTVSPELKRLRQQLEKLRGQRQQYLDSLPKSLMTVSVAPKVTRILPRGNWLDESGPEVEPDVPRFLAPLDAGHQRISRLDLAHWIVDRQNPLAARTFVNRLWKLFFGQGLTTPLDDLGVQGSRPTHPELLDWLAVEFMDSGWDTKHIIRLMVTSSTYRQTSHVSDSLRQRDPYNRWLARQSRYRLDAEMVRDNALAVSGLLVTRLGGESVKPYQPDGYWRHMNFPIRTWQNDRGENQYRRGLYTWWQRMFLHPSMLAFDATSREECTAERPRSNTPLQALVLLNDPTYIEAARVFAQRLLASDRVTTADRINWSFQQALSRDAHSSEISELTQLYEAFLADYQLDLEAAKNLVSIGYYPIPTDVNRSELAAWTSVMRVLLNLHEAVIRR